MKRRRGGDEKEGEGGGPKREADEPGHRRSATPTSSLHNRWVQRQQPRGVQVCVYIAGRGSERERGRRNFGSVAAAVFLSPLLLLLAAGKIRLDGLRKCCSSDTKAGRVAVVSPYFPPLVFTRGPRNLFSFPFLSFENKPRSSLLAKRRISKAHPKIYHPRGICRAGGWGLFGDGPTDGGGGSIDYLAPLGKQGILGAGSTTLPRGGFNALLLLLLLRFRNPRPPIFGLWFFLSSFELQGLQRFTSIRSNGRLQGALASGSIYATTALNTLKLNYPCWGVRKVKSNTDR